MAPAQVVESQNESEPDSPNPGEIRRGLPMNGNRERIMMERLLSRVQSGAKGEASNLSIYTRLFERELINDTRTFATRVSAEPISGGGVRLYGHVMFEENRVQLERLFKFLDLGEIRNEVEVLPSKSLGGNAYALVTAPGVFSYDEPTSPRETLTQGFYGEPVFLLSPAANNHFLATTAEGYIGYVSAADVRPVSEADFHAYQDGLQATVTRDYRSGELFIPTGSRLKVVSGGAEADLTTVLLPTGANAMIPSGHLRFSSIETAQLIERIISTAEAKLGSDYVWGGKTSEGVDCSGLVQSSFRSQGINLPRDTYMQAYVGTLSATRWYKKGLRRGDLIFFLGRNGKINHVAIAVDSEGRYVESAGEVKYGSLNPIHAEFDDKRAGSFAFAKRVFDL